MSVCLPILIGLIAGYLVDGVNSQKTHHQISLDEFPNPFNENSIELCGRGQKSFICDPNQYINTRLADSIDDIIYNATQSNLVWCSIKPSSENPGELVTNSQSETRQNYDGLEIGIAIISSFRSYPHRRYRHDDDIQKKSKVYAKSIHDQWGVGIAGCNNALMIFITIQDRYLYVSTGSGIKKIIKDDFVDKFLIPKHVRPMMKKSKYGEAIKFIVESIVDILRNSDNLDNHPLYQSYIDYTTPTTFFGITLESWFFIILIICGISYLIYKFHSEKDYRACERELAALHAAKQSKKFNQTSCPICLQDFPNTSNSNSNVNNGDNERETAILICGHKFCKDCLDQWFNVQSSSNQKCPICRHDRDDWSPARGETEQKIDADDEKKGDNDNDDDRKHDNVGSGTSSSSGYGKTSTSDNFYQNDNGSSTFRRRHGYNNNNHNNNNYGGMDMNDWMFQQELLFRMRRIRYFYPRYVNDEMVNRWSRPGYSGSFTRDSSFVRNNPNYVPPTTRSGSSSWGSSRSSFSGFGGGSSAGGGGGGGGW